MHPTPSFDEAKDEENDGVSVIANGHYVNSDINNSNDDEDATPCRRRNLILTALLFLPARIAVPTITLLVGRTAAKSAGASDTQSIAGGFALLMASRAAHSAGKRRRQANALMKDEVRRGVAWTEALQAVAAIVHRFTTGVGLRFALLDKRLVLLAHSAASGNLIDAARRGGTHTRPDVVDKARRYCDFAMATYGYTLLRACGMVSPEYDTFSLGTRAIDVAQWHLDLRDEDILTERLDGETIGVPRHFIAFDSVTQTVVIAIRGTNSISDVITDLLCEAAPFAAGLAHGGMADAARALYGVVTPFIKHRRTIITGHSLGAAVGLLLTKLLIDTGYDVRCYAFAPCPVYGPRSSIDNAWSDAIECFVHHQDLVAQLCLSSARRLAIEIEKAGDIEVPPGPLTKDQRKECAREVDEARQTAARDDPRMSAVQHLYLPTRRGVNWLLPVEKEGELPWWRRLFRNTKHLSDQFPSFPWNRWEIPKAVRPTKRYQSVIVNVDAFERLLITPRCVTSHFPNRYVAAFAAMPGKVKMRPGAPYVRSQPVGTYFGELGEF